MFFREFFIFVREQGVVGLAVGFILGGSTQRVVTALVNDIVSPFIGLLLPNAESLSERKIVLGSTAVLWGDFLKVVIDFLIILFIVYFGVKVLHAAKLIKRKRQ